MPASGEAIESGFDHTPGVGKAVILQSQFSGLHFLEDPPEKLMRMIFDKRKFG